MRRKIHYLIALCIVASLIFIRSIPLYACTFIPVPNYWYQLEFDIQNEALPAGVTVSPLYPNERGFIEGYRRTLGQLEFLNKSDDSIHLGSLSADAIDPNGTGIYDTTKDIKALMPNPQSPGGTEPPPSPFLYEFTIIQDSQHFTVPITVTYSLNPSYDEDRIILSAPLGDYLIQTEAVVLGEVIRVAGYSDDGGIFILVQVEEWLLGEGPEEIEIGSFSPGYSCGIGFDNISFGEMSYFLLKTPDDVASIRYPLTRNFTGSKTVLAANSENAAAIEAALEEFVTPTSLPAADEPLRLLFLRHGSDCSQIIFTISASVYHKC